MNEKNQNLKPNNLAQDLKRAQRDLSVLYEVSHAMRTTLELEHVLYIILTGVTSHSGLGFNRAILYLLNSQEQALEAKMAISPESGEEAKKIWDYIQSSSKHLDDLIEIENFNYNQKQSKLLNAIKNYKVDVSKKTAELLNNAFYLGHSLHITKEKILDYANDEFFNYFKTQELLIMPLKAKDKINGLIVVDNLFTQKPITEEDIKIFRMLANQAGLAIENSNLYELVIHKSHTDSLTNLWNHGFFQQQLSKENAVAKEHDRPLSLMIIDIDNFKQLNDAFGHQMGDVILKELANILNNSSRDIDYVCRYGGEEFAIILTQTNCKQAFAIAERVRQLIESKKFSNQNLTVTVSIGVASLYEHAHNKEELISQADKALYISKFKGKNQTNLPDLT